MNQIQNPKVNQYLRNSLALLMSEWSEEMVSARWHGDLKGVIQEEFWFKLTQHISLGTGQASGFRSKSFASYDVDDKTSMLQIAIVALSHLVGELPDFDEYWEINL